MGLEPKQLSRRKSQAIQKLPCDGVPRYRVRESALDILLPYGTAFEEVFAATGGTWKPGLTEKHPRSRVWTPDGMRRVAKLNQTYFPHARKVFESQRAAAELLKANPSTIADTEPCPAPPAASS